MKVTVIIPIYNEARRLPSLLNALRGLDYPKADTEIIFVNNNSTDDSEELIKKSKFRLIHEKKRGSYAARNTGINQSNGQIIAFTDSDCLPSKDWVTMGIRKIVAGEADIVAGNVKIITDGNSVAQLYDAGFNLNNERYLNDFNSAVTANLFARADCFLKTGLFSEIRSGGDFKWTKTASEYGLKLAFEKEAIVEHPARNFLQLMKKGFRIGMCDHLVVDSYKNVFVRILKIASYFIPRGKRLLLHVCRKNQLNNVSQNISKILFIDYCWRLTKTMGMIRSLPGYIFKFKTK